MIDYVECSVVCGKVLERLYTSLLDCPPRASESETSPVDLPPTSRWPRVDLALYPSISPSNSFWDQNGAAEVKKSDFWAHLGSLVNLRTQTLIFDIIWYPFWAPKLTKNQLCFELFLSEISASKINENRLSNFIFSFNFPPLRKMRPHGFIAASSVLLMSAS